MLPLVRVRGSAAATALITLAVGRHRPVCCGQRRLEGPRCACVGHRPRRLDGGRDGLGDERVVARVSEYASPPLSRSSSAGICDSVASVGARKSGTATAWSWARLYLTHSTAGSGADSTVRPRRRPSARAGARRGTPSPAADTVCRWSRRRRARRRSQRLPGPQRRHGHGSLRSVAGCDRLVHGRRFSVDFVECRRHVCDC